MKRSIGCDQGLRPIGQSCEREAPLAGFRDPLVPQRPALRLQRQRLHRLDADDGLAQRRRLPGLGGGDLAVQLSQRLEKGQNDQKNHDGAGEHDPRQRRVEIEQERQQHAKRDEIEKGREQPAGQKLAYPVDLGDPIHRLAGRMTLEIVERQAQQAIEDVQIELGVEPRADHRNDQPTRVAEQGFIGDDDHHHGGEQHQRRDAVELQHLVDRRHDQERREDRQKADGERSERRCRAASGAPAAPAG